jgi:phosphoribosylglycinamide formyltransferase-1
MSAPTEKPFRLAILASGRGSNLRALIDAQQRGELKTQIVGVFSDKPDCNAINLAKANAIPTIALAARDFTSREAFDEELFNRIAAVQPDLIVCAGYMRIISDTAVRRFEGRMINIHPSLLPKYPGLNTHSRALAAGDSEHGASVHLVIPELDSGPVLAQARIAVRADDAPETLAQRILAREHPLLVQSVAWLSEGRAVARGTEFVSAGRTLRTPLQLNDDNQLEEIH